MIGALWTGISGLSTAQNAIDNESNNISNVNTVAYKASRVSFADQMYQNSIGKGTSTANVQKIYETGGTQATGIAYDVALDDDGFFTVADTSSVGSPQIYYTRAGNFLQGEDGTLQTNEGYQVQGWAVSTAYEYERTNPDLLFFTDDYDTIAANQIIYYDDRIETVTAKVTDYNSSAKAITNGTSTYGNYNKTAAAVIQDVEALMSAYATALANVASDPTASSVSPISQISTITLDGTTVNATGDYITVYVNGNAITQEFDTDTATTYQKLADQISEYEGLRASITGNTITIESIIPGKDFILGSATQYDAATTTSSAVTTATTTTATAGAGSALVDETYTALENAILAANADIFQITSTVNQEATQTSLQLDLKTLGITNKNGGEYNVNDKGVITITQDGATFAIGQISVATFKANDGLKAVGNNVYEATQESGKAMYATNNSGKASISSEQLELSTADLSESLVNLMVYQRAFEANSKSITTSDELLDTLINLKR